MYSTVYLPYAVTEVFLIIFSVTILFRLNLNLGSEYEVRELKNIIYAFFAVLAADIFRVRAEGHITTPHPLLNASVNAVLLSAVAAGCCFWYKFTEYRLRSRFFPYWMAEVSIETLAQNFFQFSGNLSAHSTVKFGSGAGPRL